MASMIYLTSIYIMNVIIIYNFSLWVKRVLEIS